MGGCAVERATSSGFKRIVPIRTNILAAVCGGIARFHSTSYLDGIHQCGYFVRNSQLTTWRRFQLPWFWVQVLVESYFSWGVIFLIRIYWGSFQKSFLVGILFYAWGSVHWVFYTCDFGIWGVADLFFLSTYHTLTGILEIYGFKKIPVNMMQMLTWYSWDWRWTCMGFHSTLSRFLLYI